MPPAVAKFSQAIEHQRRWYCCRRIGGMQEDAQQSVFGQRASCPAQGAMVREPAMSGLVVNVIGVEERDENIDVKQRCATHESSRRRLTRAMVGLGLPAGRRGRSGTPLRIDGGSAGSMAFRANSESTLPAVVPRLDAMSLIASRMSSSMSRDRK